MKELELAYLRSAAHVHAVLRAHGHRPALSQALLSAALELHKPLSRDELLEQAKSFFNDKAVMVPAGLAELPMSWLADLPKLLWRSRKPHWREIPYMIKHLGFEEGVLCLTFAQELPIAEDRLTAWDRLRINLNLSLFPNLWCPLPPHLERVLWDTRPELRRELFRLPY